MKKKRLFFGVAFVLAVLFSGCDNSQVQVGLSPVWRFEYQEAGSPKAPPLPLPSGRLVASVGTDLVLLDGRNGDPIWKTQATDRFTLQSNSLIADGRRIYTAHYTADENDIRSYDLATGTLLWKHRPEDGSVSILGQFCVFGDNLYATTLPNDIYVLNSSTGSLVHKQNIAPGGTLSSVPYEDAVIIGRGINAARFPGRESNALDGEIRAIDPATGDSLWSYYTTDGAFLYDKIVVADHTVYGAAAGLVGQVVALDAKTGTVKWTQRGFGAWAHQITPDGDRLFVDAGYGIVALDRRTGTFLWQTPFEGLSLGGFEVRDGYVYRLNNGVIFVLNAETGEILDETPAPDGSFIWHIRQTSEHLIIQTTQEIAALRPYT